MAKQDLTVEVTKILKEYSDEVQEDMVKAIDTVSKEGQKRLKDTSPGGARYARSWKRMRIRDRLATSYTLYNERYYLTHLLEKGHVIMNKKGGPYGRTKAIPHIGPVEEWAVEELPKEFEKELNK